MLGKFLKKKPSASAIKPKVKAKAPEEPTEPKNILDRAGAVGTASDRGECQGETVFYNVDLKGGLAANSFKRYPGVSTMESCLGHCCELRDCNVAMIRDEDCFAVHCSTTEMCEVTDGVGKLARVWQHTSGKTK